jgi:thiamine biosynthesis protein ThiS
MDTIICGEPEKQIYGTRAMKLTINGESREFDSLSTVSELVAQLGMKPDRVAVELNRELVPRSSWSTMRVTDGDKLEIVHFVGGGS